MNKKTTVCGIVAVGPDDVIGQNNVMPWHSRQDFFHFKTMTTPYPCVFGKNTFDGLPRRPLPNRLNIVCSSKNKDEYQSGVFYSSSINSSVKSVSHPSIFKSRSFCAKMSIVRTILERSAPSAWQIASSTDISRRVSIVRATNRWLNCFYISHSGSSLPTACCT